MTSHERANRPHGGLPVLLAVATTLVIGGQGLAPLSLAAQEPSSLAPFVPTPQDVVDRMLELAEVSENDVVYDLGAATDESSSRQQSDTVPGAWVSTSIRSGSRSRKRTRSGPACPTLSSSFSRMRFRSMCQMRRWSRSICSRRQT